MRSRLFGYFLTIWCFSLAVCTHHPQTPTHHTAQARFPTPRFVAFLGRAPPPNTIPSQVWSNTGVSQQRNGKEIRRSLRSFYFLGSIVSIPPLGAMIQLRFFFVLSFVFMLILSVTVPCQADALASALALRQDDVPGPGKAMHDPLYGPVDTLAGAILGGRVPALDPFGMPVSDKRLADPPTGVDGVHAYHSEHDEHGIVVPPHAPHRQGSAGTTGDGRPAPVHGTQNASPDAATWPPLAVAGIALVTLLGALVLSRWIAAAMRQRGRRQPPSSSDGSDPDATASLPLHVLVHPTAAAAGAGVSQSARSRGATARLDSGFIMDGSVSGRLLAMRAGVSGALVRAASRFGITSPNLRPSGGSPDADTEVHSVVQPNRDILSGDAAAALGLALSVSSSPSSSSLPLAPPASTSSASDQDIAAKVEEEEEDPDATITEPPSHLLPSKKSLAPSSPAPVLQQQATATMVGEDEEDTTDYQEAKTHHPSPPLDLPLPRRLPRPLVLAALPPCQQRLAVDRRPPPQQMHPCPPPTKFTLGSFLDDPSDHEGNGDDDDDDEDDDNDNLSPNTSVQSLTAAAASDDDSFTGLPSESPRQVPTPPESDTSVADEESSSGMTRKSLSGTGGALAVAVVRDERVDPAAALAVANIANDFGLPEPILHQVVLAGPVAWRALTPTITNAMLDWARRLAGGNHRAVTTTRALEGTPRALVARLMDSDDWVRQYVPIELMGDHGPAMSGATTHLTYLARRIGSGDCAFVHIFPHEALSAPWLRSALALTRLALGSGALQQDIYYTRDYVAHTTAPYLATQDQLHLAALAPQRAIATTATNMGMAAVVDDLKRVQPHWTPLERELWAVLDGTVPALQAVLAAAVPPLATGWLTVVQTCSGGAKEGPGSTYALGLVSRTPPLSSALAALPLSQALLFGVLMPLILPGSGGGNVRPAPADVWAACHARGLSARLQAVLRVLWFTRSAAVALSGVAVDVRAVRVAARASQRGSTFHPDAASVLLPLPYAVERDLAPSPLSVPVVPAAAGAAAETPLGAVISIPRRPPCACAKCKSCVNRAIYLDSRRRALETTRKRMAVRHAALVQTERRAGRPGPPDLTPADLARVRISTTSSEWSGKPLVLALRRGLHRVARRRARAVAAAAAAATSVSAVTAGASASAAAATKEGHGSASTRNCRDGALASKAASGLASRLAAPSTTPARISRSSLVSLLWASRADRPQVVAAAAATSSSSSPAPSFGSKFTDTSSDRSSDESEEDEDDDDDDDEDHGGMDDDQPWLDVGMWDTVAYFTD
ncbi:hypothetical protein BC828DRAFT_371963 [Blastocladiella britannica]|nr:hypothetical protein BC828DRAFT_371963 [Blastocladiella britannica]